MIAFIINQQLKQVLYQLLAMKYKDKRYVSIYYEPTIKTGFIPVIS